MRIVLPWPDKRLSPNARLHWRAKHAAKAPAREAARETTADAMQRHGVDPADFGEEGRIDLIVSFYPPDKRHRDDDNMVGSFKSLRDGLADALGINDRRFRAHYFFHEPDKPGRIEVEIETLIADTYGDKFSSNVPCDDVNGLPTFQRRSA